MFGRLPHFMMRSWRRSAVGVALALAALFAIGNLVLNGAFVVHSYLTEVWFLADIDMPPASMWALNTAFWLLVLWYVRRTYTSWVEPGYDDREPDPFAE